MSDKFALNAQVVIYNLEEHQQCDTKVDMSIDVTMGCLKIVFINWFIANMLVSFKSNNVVLRVLNGFIGILE